jgi:hypothetical protein
MPARSQLTTSEDGTRVVLTKSSVGGNSLKLVSLQAVVFPAATSVLPGGHIEISLEQQSQRAGARHARTVDATVMLTPDELRAWLAGVAALLPPAGGGDV